MHFCIKGFVGFLVFVAFILVLADTPAFAINFYQQELTHIIHTNDPYSLSNLLVLFSENGHRADLYKFCNDVAVPVCKRELVAPGCTAFVQMFCNRLLTECKRYMPEGRPEKVFI